MVKTLPTALRHTPKQARGQRKVEYILRSAEELFAEVGFEAATTNGIAIRAGISIGSLYQFFASKEAILEAMADRYLEQTRSAMNRALTSPTKVRLDPLLTELLETLIKLQEQRPYFLQCLGRTGITPGLTAAVLRLNEAVAAQVAALLVRGTTEQDPAIIQLRSRICVETMGALLPLALHARGRERTTVIREIKTVLIAYLEPTLKIQGVI